MQSHTWMYTIAHVTTPTHEHTHTHTATITRAQMQGHVILPLPAMLYDPHYQQQQESNNPPHDMPHAPPPGHGQNTSQQQDDGVHTHHDGQTHHDPTILSQSKDVVASCERAVGLWVAQLKALLKNGPPPAATVCICVGCGGCGGCGGRMWCVCVGGGGSVLCVVGVYMCVLDVYMITHT